MSLSWRSFLARGVLVVLGHRPHPPVRFTPGKEAAFEALARRFVDAATNAWIEDVPQPKYEFLQWLRTRREVVFHGTKRDDLDLIRPIRLSRDATAFGDQQAVYASDDPVWAMYFAVLRKGGAMHWTRNSASRVLGSGRLPRYAFAVNVGARTPGLLGDGTIYVLPSASFRSDAAAFGVIDNCHLVSAEPVVPLARIRVGPSDFPFADAIFESRPGSGELRFAVAHWRARLRPTSKTG